MIRGASQFSDGMPVTKAEALVCTHPDLQSAYGIDGPL